jgi:hypothetical protein
MLNGNGNSPTCCGIIAVLHANIWQCLLNCLYFMQTNRAAAAQSGHLAFGITALKNKTRGSEIGQLIWM